MLAGITMQVVQLVLLAIVTAEYAIRKHVHRDELARERGAIITA